VKNKGFSIIFEKMANVSTLGRYPTNLILNDRPWDACGNRITSNSIFKATLLSGEKLCPKYRLCDNQISDLSTPIKRLVRDFAVEQNSRPFIRKALIYKIVLGWMSTYFGS